MAYRVEKEPNGKEAIVISGWESIAKDPYEGMGVMQSVNLEVPNEVSVGYPLTASTLSGGGSTLGQTIARSTRYFASYGTPIGGTGLPQAFAILDIAGRVWQSSTLSGTWTFLSSSNSTTGSTINDGVVYYLGYLFKTRGANIDYWDGSTWHTGWQTSLTTGVKHFMFVSNDNTLFITNGSNLASVIPNSVGTFDPNTSSTFTFSIAAIASGIPSSDVAVSLAEVGGGNSSQSTLLIGGSQNAIYPWDKISQSYSQPIYVADSYITNIVSANQNAFIFPGYSAGPSGRGRIYITNGSQADLWYKIPDFITGVQEPYFVWGDAIFHRNNLVFGFFVSRNGSGFADFSDVWAIELPTKKFRSISTLTPAATGTGIARTLIGLPTSGLGFSYIAGWDDNAGSPVSVISYSNTQAGTGSATIKTDLIPIGTFLQKRTFSQVEFKLRSPLQSGETLTITPVVDEVAGTAYTFTPTITTNSISAIAPATFTGAQWVRFTITLTGNSNFSGCRLFELRLR